MRILVTTFGTSWPVVPELLAFTNPAQVPLLAAHPAATEIETLRARFRINPVDAVWLATTSGERIQGAIQALQSWHDASVNLPQLRVFTMEGIVDLSSVNECLRMREVIFRLVLHARALSQNGGACYLSLAGGRKTMSADMQLAADCFGCDALLHVVDTGAVPPALGWGAAPETPLKPVAPECAASISPLVVRGATRGQEWFQLPGAELPLEAYPIRLETSHRAVIMGASTTLIDRVEAIRAEAESLKMNFTRQLLESTEAANFHALYTLEPERIQCLKSAKITGTAEDLEWLQTLPKAELHCHLGGVLDAAGHLRVAEAIVPELEAAVAADPAFAEGVNRLRSWRMVSPEALRERLGAGGWKEWRDNYGRKRRHLYSAALLLYALGQPERVDQLLFGPLLNPACFRGIGITAYEALGDLQGSTLLQSEAALRAVCSEVRAMARADQWIYGELRCSPWNCTLGGLSVDRVIQILGEALNEDFGGCLFRLIFIASRHGDERLIEKTVRLAENGPANIGSWFAGFDLAGAEHARSPFDVRQAFETALRRCENITIHAGEGEPPSNIWEAVYALNADRIGHGLTLPEAPELMERLRRRRVAIELCPSSNRQITAYGNTRAYPLREFLDRGLRVTINTDDPGMSRTSLGREFAVAADLCNGTLSRWEVLQLIRNSYKAAFCPMSERKQLLLAAERHLLKNKLV